MWGCGVRLDRDTSQAITSAPCVTAATSTCAGSRRAHFVSATSASVAVGAATRQAAWQPLKGQGPSFRADEHSQVCQLLGTTDERRELRRKVAGGQQPGRGHRPPFGGRHGHAQHQGLVEGNGLRHRRHTEFFAQHTFDAPVFLERSVAIAGAVVQRHDLAGGLLAQRIAAHDLRGIVDGACQVAGRLVLVGEMLESCIRGSAVRRAGSPGRRRCRTTSPG